jgi:hypothetical protein
MTTRRWYLVGFLIAAAVVGFTFWYNADWNAYWYDEDGPHAEFELYWYEQFVVSAVVGCSSGLIIVGILAVTHRMRVILASRRGHTCPICGELPLHNDHECDHAYRFPNP